MFKRDVMNFSKHGTNISENFFGFRIYNNMKNNLVGNLDNHDDYAKRFHKVGNNIYGESQRL